MHDDSRSRRVAVGLALTGLVAPFAAFAVNWLRFGHDSFAGWLALLFIGIPLAVSFLLAALLVWIGARRQAREHDPHPRQP